MKRGYKAIYIGSIDKDYSLAFYVFTLLAMLSSATFIFVKPDRLIDLS